MKIFIFTMTLNRGGAERVIANLCNEYLIKEDNEITIITCINAPSQYLLDSRIQQICLDEKYEQKNQNKIHRFIRRRKVFQKILDVYKPDILLCFLPEPSFLALSCRKQCTFPIIVSVRSDPTMEYTFLPYNILMNVLYPMADGLIMQTQDAKRFFPKQIQRKTVIIPNPINIAAIRPSYSGKRRNEIVAVGRLTAEKNYPLLIRAFKRVCEEYPEYKLVIYGEGPQREQLEKLIQETELVHRVILAGQQDNVFDLIYQCKLFVMTSTHEGMPNALMEAMALGLPVISTDCPCGGPRFLIQNEKNGLLVPTEDEDALVQAIGRLLRNPALATKLGQQAEKIAETLVPQKIYKIWDDYINEVVCIRKGDNLGMRKKKTYVMEDKCI